MIIVLLLSEDSCKERGFGAEVGGKGGSANAFIVDKKCCIV